MPSGFFETLEDRLAFVNELGRPFEQAVLLFVMLDNMGTWWARWLPQPASSNWTERQQFGEFIVACGNMADVLDRISIPHLSNVAASFPGTPRRWHPHIARVTAWCSSHLPQDEIGRRSPRQLDEDPLFDVAMRELAGVPQDLVRRSRIAEVLYEYGRCFLIHEGRSGSDHFPALGHNGDMPSYLGHSHNLGLPVPFVRAIAAACLAGFKQQMIAQGVEPKLSSPMPVWVDEDAADTGPPDDI